MPNCDIYCFSATGNSLAVARSVAARLGGRSLSMAEALRDEGRGKGRKAAGNGGVIGLVFPVYYASLGASGLPLLVRRFLAGPEVRAATYVFAVATHSGNPGSTLRNLRAALRAHGAELGAGIDLHMSVPYGPAAKLSYALFHTPLPAWGRRDAERERTLLARLPRRLDDLADSIGKRVFIPDPDLGREPGILGAAFLALQNRAMVRRYRSLSGTRASGVDQLVAAADRGFRLAEDCRGCGTCAKVCPVGNIELEGDRPVWRHSCETCYACYQWCPRGAIGGPLVEFERRRHHPEISLADMLARGGRAGGRGNAALQPRSVS